MREKVTPATSEIALPSAAAAIVDKPDESLILFK